MVAVYLYIGCVHGMYGHRYQESVTRSLACYLNNVHMHIHNACFIEMDYLSNLNGQARKFLQNLVVKSIDFLIRQCALIAAVVDPVTEAFLACLGGSELVYELNVLDQCASNVTYNFHDIVLVKGGWLCFGG